MYGLNVKNVKEAVQDTDCFKPKELKEMGELSDYCSSKASQKAIEWKLGKITWDNKADAYRHFIWNYESIGKFGLAKTITFMNRHEDMEQIYIGTLKDGTKCYLTPIASLMDITNNYYGRTFAMSDEKYKNADEAFNAALNKKVLLLSLYETRQYFNIEKTWICPPNYKGYKNKYESVIIQNKISYIGGIPSGVVLVNPSDVIGGK